jgi:succinate dehydrogenase / fumarate reductase membrane anchor subunit
MAITSLTSSGIKDFFVQRVTAIIVAIYFAYVLIESLCLYYCGTLNYDTWHAIFMGNIFFKVATLMAYLSMFLHAWVGIWIICSDYIKPAIASSFVMLVFVLSYVFCFFWLCTILFN